MTTLDTPAAIDAPSERTRIKRYHWLAKYMFMSSPNCH